MTISLSRSKSNILGGYLSRKSKEDVEDVNEIKIQNPCKRYAHLFMRYICRCKHKEKYDGSNPRNFFNPIVNLRSQRIDSDRSPSSSAQSHD